MAYFIDKNLWITLSIRILSFFVLSLFVIPVFAAEKNPIDQILSEGGYQKIDDILQKKQTFTGPQDFTITKFHSDITINEDSSFTVKEAIHVEFYRQKHGIYREIPFRYRDDLGKFIKMPIEVLAVTDETGKNLIVMINLWYKRGRDPRAKDAVTVMYEPPKYNNRPLSPAEVGALIDEKLDPRDITSTIVGLAVKGYIKIEETKKEGLIFDSTDYYLSKIKEPDDNLSLFEIEMMKDIFPGSLPGVRVSDMKNKFYTNLETLKETLYGELVRKGYFLRSPENIRKFYVKAGIIIIVFGIFFTAALLTPHSIGKSVIAWIMAGLPILGFSRVMPAKTKAGSSAYMDILGFQEFMNRAEKDRLERMKDKDLFSKFLPYAIALDVADNWAKAFEGIYQEPPQWYTSPMGFRTFSPYSFSHSLSSVTSSLSSAIFSSPRGSGISGGGGFGGSGSSGGGFGGGGGGSW